MPSVGNELNHTLDGLTVRGGLAIAGDAGANAYINRDVAADLARQNALKRGLGYYAETAPIQGAFNSSAGTSQALYGCAVGLLAGDVVNSITVLASVVSTAATLVRVAIYSTGGTLLASSATNHGAFNAPGGVVTTSLSAPYTILSDGVYYASILQVAGTGATLQLTRGTVLLAFGAVGSGVASTVIQTGQSDLPASATWATASTSRYWWMGIA